MTEQSEYTGLVGEFGGTSVTNPSAERAEEEGREEMDMDPTQDEMERERLVARAEQLQDDIESLRKQLHDKEVELADVKTQLGITPYTEFKQSVSHGWEVLGTKWKGMQETETYRKIDDRLTGWKSKMEESSAYQKTVTTLSDSSKKAGGAISSAGTKIKENEKVKAIGEKTSSALKRTGTAISGAATSIKGRVWSTVDNDDGEETVPDASTEAASPQKEEVIPDIPK